MEELSSLAPKQPEKSGGTSSSHSSSQNDDSQTSNDPVIFLDVADDEMVEVAPEPIAFDSTRWVQFSTRLAINGLLVIVLSATFAWLYVGAAWQIDTTQIVYGVAIAPQLDYSVFPAAVAARLPPPLAIINSTFLQPFSTFTAGRFGLELLTDVTTRSSALELADDGGRVWSVVWIPEDYARTIVGGMLNGTKPASLELIHDSAKHYTSETSFYSAFQTFFQSYRQSVGTSLAAQATQLLGAAPATSAFWIQGPVALNVTDLHPVTKSAQNLHSFIAFVVLYVSAILTITMASRIHDPYHPFRQGAIRLLVSFLYMFFQTLMVAMIPWCLPDNQGSFAEAWGWWLLVGLEQLAFVCMFYLYFGRMFGQALATFFLYLSLCTSSAIVALPISPRFFRLGYGLPSYYAVHGARAIYFGSGRNLLYRDALAVAAWLVGCFVLIVVGYALRLNVLVGQKLYAKSRAKIVVPPKIKKQAAVVEVVVKVGNGQALA
ncbi:hypothetical protein M427DRAFT_130456 [Gonapodya prolifera JEL478]|uniref:DUF3533 domain-containing protein n=1 Tax=Gonapodya prolifera (strain JEL478) TaxID=1344416 RepID=A0A139AYF6_GONPJ|nr:hypothetical protein M427DRAFT_130456 [Gonapodya prolifera JEL478]|eukprot:KXS21737.1 hypothetical protein M427DRAFT_130456 [Gonapodya prolifera JEL478]